MTEYKFNNNKIASGINLVCPGCSEYIEQADIETFMRCPYCNRKFSHSNELEDFILAPVVDRWVSQHCDLKHETPQGFGFRVGR